MKRNNKKSQDKIIEEILKKIAKVFRKKGKLHPPRLNWNGIQGLKLLEWLKMEKSD